MRDKTGKGMVNDMGKGNACVHGDFEGLYYIDWENFSCEYEDEDGETHVDYEYRTEEWEMSLELFIEDFTKRFKSFSKSDGWLSREEETVLESSLFYIVNGFVLDE